MQRIVIVGGGLAGFEAARALRSQGFAGDLVMLAAEQEPPYDRPPLSKDVLAWRDVSLHFDMSAVPDLDLRLGTPATGLEPGAVLDRRRTAGRATASCSRSGRTPSRCRGRTTLRTLADAHRLRDSLRDGRRGGHHRRGMDRRRGGLRRRGERLLGHRLRGRRLTAVGCTAAGPRDAHRRSGTSSWASTSGSVSGSMTCPLSVPTSCWPASVRVRPPASSPTALSSCATATVRSSSTTGCGRRCPASSRSVTARPGGRRGTTPACGSSTGTPRCTRRPWRPRYCWLGRADVDVEPYDPVPYFWSDQFGHTHPVRGAPRRQSDRRVDRCEEARLGGRLVPRHRGRPAAHRPGRRRPSARPDPGAPPHDGRDADRPGEVRRRRPCRSRPAPWGESRAATVAG